MASGGGKAAQPPGPSTVNGTAAEFQNIEQELYDYQMHSKMCKKIAQLTKVRQNTGEFTRHVACNAAEFQIVSQSSLCPIHSVPNMVLLPMG